MQFSIFTYTTSAREVIVESVGYQITIKREYLLGVNIIGVINLFFN